MKVYGIEQGQLVELVQGDDIEHLEELIPSDSNHTLAWHRAGWARLGWPQRDGYSLWEDDGQPLAAFDQYRFVFELPQGWVVLVRDDAAEYLTALKLLEPISTHTAAVYLREIHDLYANSP